MILLPGYIISFIVAFVLCLSDLPSESPELYKVSFHFFLSALNVHFNVSTFQSLLLRATGNLISAIY